MVAWNRRTAEQCLDVTASVGQTERDAELTAADLYVDYSGGGHRRSFIQRVP